MEALQVIEQRRAVRSYRSAPIERALIVRIIENAVLAPSAMNAQPWAFAVVTGSERLDQLGHRAREYFRASSAGGELTERLTAMLEDAQFRMFYGAPALVIVLATSEKRQAREDACLAAQTLMLAAREHQLGTCWIGLAQPWLESSEAREELGIPAGHAVVAPLILGYPTSWPLSPGRRPPEIHWVEAGPDRGPKRTRPLPRPSVSRPLSAGEQEELFEAFGACDADGNGRIGFLEFSELLRELGSEEVEAQHLRQFEAIDTDRDGHIDRHEFLRWWRGA